MKNWLQFVKLHMLYFKMQALFVTWYISQVHSQTTNETR